MKKKMFALAVLALLAIALFNLNPDMLEHVVKSIRYAGDSIELVYDPLDGHEITGSVDENLHRITSARDVVGQEIPPQLYKDIASTGVRVEWIPISGSDLLRKAVNSTDSLRSGLRSAELGKDSTF